MKTYSGTAQLLPFIHVHKFCHIYLFMHLLTTGDPWMYQNNHSPAIPSSLCPTKELLGDLDAHNLPLTSREVRVVVSEIPMKMLLHGCSVSAVGNEVSCVTSLYYAFYGALLRVPVLFCQYTNFSPMQG